MSIFSSQTTWPAGCSSATQSPINLSQSSAKPCQLSCDLVMDKGQISQATVSISNEGLLLMNNAGLGSCKFREETYLATAICINHPAHHTIEGVQADAECIVYFTKPTGETLCVSFLVRVNSNQTRSYSFFKQFVPYAVNSGDVKIKLQDWELSQLLPGDGSYYTYSGSTILPPCRPCEWVVYKQMINMDQGDFAFLVNNVQAGSRSIQPIGNRELFFNNAQGDNWAMPNDNKFYLRLRPTGNTKLKKEKPNIDLKTTQQSRRDALEEERHPTTMSGKAWKGMNDHIAANGGLLETVELALLVGLSIYAGYTGMNQAYKNPFAPKWFQEIALWIRGLFSPRKAIAT